jgi:hypothetical protein
VFAAVDGVAAVAIGRPFTGILSDSGSGNNMFKHPNTDKSGKPFDVAIVEAVWSKAPLSSEHPPMRIDAYGALIWKGGYGNINSKFGWEIGHRQPLVNGAADELDNLQPLQWENNRRTGEN